MINRASVQLWGIAGQSAGPPKSAGKKSDRHVEEMQKRNLVEIGTSIFFLSEFATKWPAQQDNFWKYMPFSSKMSELNG